MIKAEGPYAVYERRLGAPVAAGWAHGSAFERLVRQPEKVQRSVEAVLQTASRILMTGRSEGLTGDLCEDVLAADRYDAEGNFDEAVNALARATRAGDVEATTRLGKRLLVGDRAPAMPDNGARFIVEAAQAGGAEAAAMLSVLVAAGICMEPNWNNALNILLTAAERGWVPAQHQLCALAGNRTLAAEGLATPEAPAELWRDITRSIDFSYWNAEPDIVSLHDDPAVRRLPDFAPLPVCDLLMERSKGRLGRARVYDSLKREEVTHRTRTNTAATFGLLDTDLVQLLVQARMSRACQIPMSHMEAMSVLHYDVGEEITNHYDFVDPKTPNYDEEIATRGQRVITFLVYLNDDYTGGETEFPRMGVTHKGAAGEGLYFVNALPDGAADIRTVHAGRPTATGEKWIVSQFIRDRSARPGHDSR